MPIPVVADAVCELMFFALGTGDLRGRQIRFEVEQVNEEILNSQQQLQLATSSIDGRKKECNQKPRVENRRRVGCW